LYILFKHPGNQLRGAIFLGVYNEKLTPASAVFMGFRWGCRKNPNPLTAEVTKS